jgi:hypothetical protein
MFVNSYAPVLSLISFLETPVMMFVSVMVTPDIDAFVESDVDPFNELTADWEQAIPAVRIKQVLKLSSEFVASTRSAEIRSRQRDTAWILGRSAVAAYAIVGIRFA